MFYPEGGALLLEKLTSIYYNSLFLIFFFAIWLISQRSSRDQEFRFFWLTLISCLLLVIQDFLETITSLDPDLKFWRTTLSIFGYFLRTTAAVGLVLAAGNPEHRKKWLWIPCFINLAVCCTAYFSDIAFGFDQDYRFYRGPLGYVPFIIPILYLVYILGISHRRFLRYDRRFDQQLLIGCALFCLLSGALDALYGGVRLHDAMLISSVFFYLFLRSYDIRKDALTQLLNRQSLYDDCLSKRRSISAAVSLDFNGLKQLNDSLGHTAGDEALRKVGECIRESLGSNALGYRIGGDEFVILYTHTDESSVRKSIDSIQKTTMENGCSIACGYAMREAGEDPETLIQRSDMKMFEDKARFYQERRNDRRKARREERKEDHSGGRRQILEDSAPPAAVYRFCDHEMEVLAVSDGFCSLFGYASREQAVHVLDRQLVSNIHADDQDRFSGAMLRFFDGSETLNVVYRSKTGLDSGYRVIHARGSLMHKSSGEAIATVWFMDEGRYTEEMEETGTQLTGALNQALHEESILHAAQFDALTGLPNLTWFFKLFEAGKNKILQEDRQIALLYIDLNGMQYFNQRFGFAEGDRLLKSLAEVMIPIFGKENCCHITADHFAAASIEDSVPDKIQELFKNAEKMNGGKTLPVRIGVYSTAMENVSASMAYDRAKTACNSTFKSDTSTCRYYNDELWKATQRQQYLVENFDRAVSEKWIKAYYQPIVRAVNGKVCDEEALARWIDPEQGILPPSEFIPQLERSGLIHKLDLCILDQVLEKIQSEMKEGLYSVPVSINLSRNDFDACDIVEEIRRRVDDAGVSHDRISVEITESTIGRESSFMKEQINRFHQMGFQVWIDDFGSGYSSLDVLQSIPFDLIKFDNTFMRKLNDGESGRIILTEMMKMATALGVDTICEGVETEEQKRFLQEIGCSKLQGYYFSMPLPIEKVHEKHRHGSRIDFENPEASDYFDTIGRIDLYNLSGITRTDEHPFQHSFNTLPTAVIEVMEAKVRYVRTTPSYREFMSRFFGFNLPELSAEYQEYSTPFMKNIVKNCCEQVSQTFFDEKMRDGSVVHSFARRIAENPISGSIAVVIVVLSISDSGQNESLAVPAHTQEDVE